MPVTTMDRFSETQEKILEHRLKACAGYPALWEKMIAEWNAPDPHDRVWLIYSANYLFRTNNIRWAIDPLTLHWRLKYPPQVNAARDLQHLSFVLLTHAHGDHLDLDLLSTLRDSPIKWVVPESIQAEVITKAGLAPENMILPAPLNLIELYGLRILPFEGLHWERLQDGTLRGVPSMGYLIECNGRRWLFPGDTRNYNSAQLPVFARIDTVFAHLWLGRGSALEDRPPLLEAFCRFCLETGGQEIILTHLHELGRDANDYWDEMHAQSVCKRVQETSAELKIFHLAMGESALL